MDIWFCLVLWNEKQREIYAKSVYDEEEEGGEHER